MTDIQKYNKIINNLAKRYKITTVRKRNLTVAEADLGKRVVVIPCIRSARDFIICLHEIGHVANQWGYSKMDRYRCEYLTEQWALKLAKRYKIDLNKPEEFKDYLIDAKRYVITCCQEDNKVIPQYILTWSQAKPSYNYEKR